MKSWLIIGTLVVVTALVARYLGHVRGERAVLAEDAREQAAIRDRQRNLAEAIARHVTAGAEIALVTTPPAPDGQVVPTFRDDAWRAKLAALIADAPCEPTPHGLWVSQPALEFRSAGTGKDVKTTTFMWQGGTLRVMSKSLSGDFLVGEAVTAELSAWVKAKIPATPAAPDAAP